LAERTAPQWVLVARLVRPHGRRGELVAEILTDFPERFHERSRLVLIPPERIGTRPREMELESFWFMRSRMVMKFRGIESINDAESLRGFSVAIPFDERAPLEAGSYYLSDLIGCRVVDLNGGGVEVGVVADVDRDASNADLLVVHPPGRKPGEEHLIPLVRQYLIRVDPENKLVEMRLPEGLLEINAPMTEEEKREANQKR
jgi:16S rRNA processing protein RimM